MEKKGQVTYFVLAGLVLLIAVLTYYMYSNLRVQTELELLTAERAQLPNHIQPVAQFLDDCARRAAIDALNLVGSQGGYLTLPSDPLPTTPFSPIPPALEIIPRSDFRVPLWYRERGNNLPEVKAPTKQDVEASLAAAITQTYPQCLDDLSPTFAAQGFTFARSPTVPEVFVTLHPENVDVVIDYPITARIHDSTFPLTNALTSIQTKFGTLFTIAQEIFTTELTQTFLENKTLDILVAYDPEIPFSGTSFSCNERVWSKTHITNRLKAVLFENIAAMRIHGTNYIDDPKLHYLTFNVLSQPANEISVSLLYSPFWPTLVDITPSKGDILRGDLMSEKSNNLVSRTLSSFFCINNHHFLYTIKYPVLFTLRDPQGFIFQFATTIIIDRNVPRRNLLLPPVLPDTTSPTCAFKEHALTVNIFSTRSDGTPTPLDDASLTFKCFPTVCPLDPDPSGSHRALVRVPTCLNGILEASKPGYLSGKALVSTNAEVPEEVNLHLEPIYPKQIELFVIEKESGEVRKPYPSETITFQFERFNPGGVNDYITYQAAGATCDNDDACGPGLVCAARKCHYRSCTSDDECEFGSCRNNQCTLKKTLKLAVGTYHVRALIMRTSTHPFVTPKRTTQRCVDVPAAGLLGFFKTEEKCITTEVPSLELPSVLVGGATFDHTLTRDDLTNEEPLNLYVLAEQPPATIEDFGRIQLAIDTNHHHPLFRTPHV